MLNKSSPQKYRRFLESLGSELDQSQPGVFEWRLGKPSSDVVEGLIITKADRAGYIFVVGSAHWTGSTQGGVWREGAEHSYDASIMQQREWEEPSKRHSEAIYLESRCSVRATEIIQWIVNDWAFERPWRAPLPIDAQAERKRLQKMAQGLAARAEIAVIVKAKVDDKLNLTPEGSAALRPI